MRVGIDYRPALSNREGIGRYTRELVRALLELNFGRNLGLYGYTLAGLRVPPEELGLAGTGAELVRLRLPQKWMPALLARLGKGVDDLVGGAEVYHHTSYQRLAVRRAAEVATLHDTLYLNSAAGYVDAATGERMGAAARELARASKRILVPSEFSGAEVVMSFGVWPAQVAVTPLGCDHVLRHLPAEVPRARQPFVLTVARVDARKNHLRMLRAFERLVAAGLPQRWIVCGPRGFGCEDFERALAVSPARERVEWRTEVSDRELPTLYAQCDLFLFASLAEGFGLPPLEAQACGAPVLASCVSSMPEVLGDSALLVEPTDEDAIFTAARQILSEPEIASDLRRRGRVRARRFTWRECARLTLIAYQAATQPLDAKPGLRRAL